MGVSGWLKWLRRDSYIFKATPKRTKFVVKDFRACHNLLNHILDGHIIALFGTMVNANNVEEFCRILENQNINWRKLVKASQIRYSSPATVDKMRDAPSNSRDIPHENAILFLQHGLMYRDFVHAMRTGDVGRMELCLRTFAVWFQASGSGQYARELLHLMACIKHHWTAEFHEYWQQTLLVNVSGSPKGFMPPDLVNEWVVREFKRHVRATSHGKGFEYVLETLVPLCFISRNCRKQMVKDTGATYYYKHSVIVNVWTDVKSIANRLLQTRVFERHPGRVVSIPHEGIMLNLNSTESTTKTKISHYEATDLYCNGLAKLSDGSAIRKYKDWLKCGRGVVDDVEMDEFDDNEDINDMEQVNIEYDLTQEFIDDDDF
jgi:hypothetical protein